MDKGLLRRATDKAMEMVQGSQYDRDEMARMLTNSLLGMLQDGMPVDVAMTKMIENLGSR